MKSKKRKIPKIPKTEEKEPETRTTYDEEPLIKTKSKYSEDEIEEEAEEALEE